MPFRCPVGDVKIPLDGTSLSFEVNAFDQHPPGPHLPTRLHAPSYKSYVNFLKKAII